MKEEYSKKELFETMPVPKALVKMAIPTAISQLIHLVYSLVDTFFIGRTGNSLMMAGVTASFPLFVLTIALANLFGIGGGSTMTRFMGRKEPQTAKKACAFSFYGAILVSILYGGVIQLCMEPLLTALGASEATMLYARQYTFVVVVVGAIPAVMAPMLAHLLRNLGYATKASIGVSSGGILNIALDPLLMFVLLPEGQEVLGAALATTISNYLSLGYLLFVFIRLQKTTTASVRPSDALSAPKAAIKEVFSVGIPSALLTGLADLANIVLNHLMSTHGDYQLAAIGIVMKAERLPNALNISISQGMLPIVAYNYASGNHDRMRETIKTARRYGLTIALCCIVLFELLAKQITGVFLSTSGDTAESALTTLGFAVIFLRLRVFASPVQFLNFHTSFSMQAMGNGRGTLLHAFIREFICYIPLMYILDKLFGEYGLASAFVLGEGLGALAALLILKAWLRKLAKQIQPV